ncbi:glutaredoxin 3 [Bartonella bacilliformis str. Heidi Mejia]|uniref:Glutaredoxin n=2 Tax=Bartonella bacilliformis TaxID=774 RepID=A1URT4_BARBK|nr:glutaredoxin 3 [Bartonella bacilliformis]ABM45276.1 glutaredoxin 3 [Bartonella bacilliformis KC583]AMG85532.1 glutaredoxin 3 [Bartonella bacilliformis]EKS44940.1 glutaredoxin [Bartonella bacilliformis INS]EYS90178.1 glutaredoxin 3 [Bartonella bacilliformis San Pedro600-02]EYS92342.1 glutaredoxin 3 [Bartonella bacilliformis str. Heidi Mejia]
MKEVTLYTRPNCPYCTKARILLDKKGIKYTDIDASTSLRQEMVKRANGRNTFPQIFIGDYHVGGYDDLHSLDAEGKLDSLLNNAQ